MPQLENGTDLLICELAHFPPESLFRFLQKFRISRLVLTHGSAEVLAKVDSVVAEARAMLPKTEIIFAADKMKVHLATRKSG